MKKVTIALLSLAAASLVPCFGAEFQINTNVADGPAFRVLERFRELSRLELIIASNVKNAGDPLVIVQVSPRRPAERAEAARLIERSLLEQAGIIITRLDDKRASVTYNDALPVRLGERPLQGRFFRGRAMKSPDR